MKKLSVLVALALLAVAGTGFAVTCAYDNVPAATLLVPYFRVSGTVNSLGYITAVGTDTKVAFVNVSQPGVIAHVTVWNKYSAAVLDFNVPMTGKDVVTFNMSGVLNGALNVNPTTQVYTPKVPTPGDETTTKDVCGVKLGAPTTYNATPYLGWGQTQYIRVPHPLAAVPGADWSVSVSRYATPDAFSSFRLQVMMSLDESTDITEFQTSAGTGILDVTNFACFWDANDPTNPNPTPPGTYAGGGDFTGYLTIDVVNFCTNWFPNQGEFYQYDAIATSGWGQYGYTPNVLMGDVFYVDATAGPVGNISGDPTVNLEYDGRLDWFTGMPFTSGTFYGRFVQESPGPGSCEETTNGCANLPAGYQSFQFGGDGREPLGDHYGWRYLANATHQFRTWILVWRGDDYFDSGVDLCSWLRNGGLGGDGFYDAKHALTWHTYDEDENEFVQQQGGGPSGGQTPTNKPLYIFLETQRIALADATGTGNTEIIPGWGQPISSSNSFPTLLPGNNWYGGWMDILFRDPTYNSSFNQAWVGVQHSGPGTTLSVGHSATNLNGDWNCNPPRVFREPGVVVTPVN